MHKAVPYVIAAALGVGLAVLLFPGGASVDIQGLTGKTGARGRVGAEADVVGAPTTTPADRAESRAGASGPREPVTVSRGAERKASPVPISPNPVSAAMAERRDTPVGRHAAQDAPKWIRVSQVLAENGYEDLSKEARDTATALRTALHPPEGFDATGLLDQERAFIGKLHDTGAISVVTEEVGLIEAGLTAAQQGGVPPVDDGAQE